MLIAWMIYAGAFAAIVAAGALALDRVREIWNAPRRLVWLAALGVAALAPVGLAVMRPAAPATVRRGVELPAPSDPVERRLVVLHGAPPAATSSVVQRIAAAVKRVPTRYPAGWNRIALGGWLAVSGGLITLFVHGAVTMRRRRRVWREMIVDGCAVTITTDVGPAVVGALRPRILLPAWVLSLDAAERELMLRHEAEHIRARDPAALLVAALVLALFPWNPALWLIVRRLRLAIEIDCDRRVLQADARTHEYGMLLLAVGARSGALRFTAALAEPRLFLERRILAMTTARHTRPIIASLPFAALAMVAAAAAAQTPRPAPVPLPAAPVAPVEAPTPVPVSPATVAPVPRPMPSVVPAPIALPSQVAPTPLVAPTLRVTAAPVPPVMPASAPQVMPAAAPLAPVPIDAVRPLAPVVDRIAPPAPREWTVPLEMIREWIREHHPTVLAGDASINSVIIVTDAGDRYLKSAADSVFGATDFVDAATGKLVIDTAAMRRVLPLPEGRRPMYIVDGVRVDSIEAWRMVGAQTLELLKGSAAATAYGADAANGVVVVTTGGFAARLTRLGIDPRQIDEMEVLRKL